MKLLVAIIVLFVIYTIQRILYARQWDRKLGVACHFSKDYIECGESAELIETIVNGKSLPLPVFHIKFSVDRGLKFDDMENASVTDRYYKNEAFSIMGHQRVIRKNAFKGMQRGIMEIGNVTISVRDFFMTATFADSIVIQDTIYVFPKKKTDIRFNNFYRGIIGEIETKRSVIEDNQIFRGIRPYQHFDTMKSINWKQSAKARELMVNMSGYTMDAHVKILLDLDADVMVEYDRIKEEAISLASSLTRRFLMKRVAVSITTNGVNSDGELIRPIEESIEMSHGITIDKALTEIEGPGDKNSFLEILDNEIKAPADAVQYLIISSSHKSEMIQKVDRLCDSGAGVSMIVVYNSRMPYLSERDYIKTWEVELNG